MKSKVIKILCILSLSTFLVSCSSFGTNNVANVTVTSVKTESELNETVYTTNIESEDSISVFPSSVGKVESISVEVGQEVKKDDVLFTVDNTDLTYKFNAAKANYESAKANYDKVSSGSAKQAQVDAEKALEAAKNELKNAQEAYDIAKNQYENNTNVAAAQAAYDAAKQNYDRTNELYNADAVAQIDLETAQNKLDTAKAALDIAIDNSKMALSSAETRLSNAQASYNSASTNANITNSITNPDNIAAAKASMDAAKASLDSAQYALDNTTVKSPIDGKVSAKNITVGEYTSAQTPSLVITGENSLIAKIKVTETKIQSIKEGQKANIYLPANGLSYEGTVYAISPSADATNGMFEVKISISNPDDKIKVGMVSNITIQNDSKDSSLLVPSKCIFKDGDKSYVYVINGDVLSKREITVESAKNDYLVIKSGIKKNDKVVVQGSDNMADNMKYNIVKSN